MLNSLCFFFEDFIYLTEREKSQVGREAGREREEEAGSPLSTEPNAGLDPNHDLSGRQRLNPLSHPGDPSRQNI